MPARRKCRLPALAFTLVVAACGASSQQTRPPTPRGTGLVARDPAHATSAAQPPFRAHAPLPMPVCTADDLRAIASLTPGLPAVPVIAATSRGALVAFVADADHNGAAELLVVSLDERGATRGVAHAIESGSNPARPALSADGNGYTLAWREGERGHESIASVRLDETGAVQGRRANAYGVGGFLGAPSVLRQGSDDLIVCVQSTTAGDPDERRGDSVRWALGGRGGLIPGGTRRVFDGETAPLVTPAGSAFVSYISRTGDGSRTSSERALALLDLGANAERQIAHDVASPTMYANARGGMLLGWRGAVASSHAALRVYAPDGLAPPATVATYRGAFGAELGFVALGDERVGAFTWSTLGDDEGGSLNVSVVTEHGDLVGRTPLLVSAMVRSARVAIARTNDSILVAVDGRTDVGGSPVLGLAVVHCSTSTAVNPLEIPPPGLVQQQIASDEPPERMDRTSASAPGTCRAEGGPSTVAAHSSGQADALAGSDAAVVALGDTDVVFAVVKSAGETVRRLSVATVSARGDVVATARAVDGAVRVLAAIRVGREAVVVVSSQANAYEPERVTVLRVDAGGRIRTTRTLPLVDPTSAAISPDDGAVFVAAAHERTPADHQLWRVPQRGDPGEFVSLRPGDNILDVARRHAGAVAILERPDPFGASTARMLATSSVSAPQRGDPFADPIGYGRGAARWSQGTSTEAIVYSEREYLRATQWDANAVREPRSVFAVRESGGALLAHADGADGSRWFALASGVAPASSAAPSPFTLVRVAADGTVRTASDAIPADPGAIPGHARIAAHGDRVSVLYARAESDGMLRWMLGRGQCAAPRAEGARR